MSLQDYRRYNGQKIARFATTQTEIVVYTSEGETLRMRQGTEEADYFIQLLERRGFMKWRKPVIDIPLDEENKPKQPDESTYSLFSKLTGGVITFVKKLVTPEERASQTDEQQIAKPLHVFLDRDDAEKIAEAQGAMTAVVDGVEVPNVHKLQHYIKTAVKLKDAKGFANLLKRLAAVDASRAHSVDDAITFLSTAELPITDDGDIITYRVVSDYNERKKTFFDKHTGRVPQNVGTVVEIDEKLINRSRGVSCAEGLHVSTLGYIRGFHSSGNGLFVCLVRPEDIIVVPHNVNTKVRVSSYRVVGLLSGDEASHVLSGKSLVTYEGKGNVDMSALIAGVYPPVIQNVLITSSKATTIKVTDVKIGVDLAEAPDTSTEPAPEPEEEKGVTREVVEAPEPAKEPVKKVTARHRKMAKTESVPLEEKPKAVRPKHVSTKRLKPSTVNKMKAGVRPTHAWNTATNTGVITPSANQKAVIQDIIDNPDMSYTEVCKLHGVARSTVFGWLDKFTVKS